MLQRIEGAGHRLGDDIGYLVTVLPQTDTKLIGGGDEAGGDARQIRCLLTTQALDGADQLLHRVNGCGHGLHIDLRDFLRVLAKTNAQLVGSGDESGGNAREIGCIFGAKALNRWDELLQCIQGLHNQFRFVVLRQRLGISGHGRTHIGKTVAELGPGAVAAPDFGQPRGIRKLALEVVQRRSSLQRLLDLVDTEVFIAHRFGERLHGTTELGKAVADRRPALLAIKQTIPDGDVGKLVQQLAERSRGLNALIHTGLINIGRILGEGVHGRGHISQTGGERTPFLLTGDLLPSAGGRKAVEDVGQRCGRLYALVQTVLVDVGALVAEGLHRIRERQQLGTEILDAVVPEERGNGIEERSGR